MPAEAAANVADISHRLDMAADGFVADTQCHAEFFGADFIVPLDERDDFCIQIVLSDILTDILGDILTDTLRDTVIQVRHNDRKLVAVRTECRAFILGVVDLCLVAVQNFTEAAALALHVAKAVEHIGQRSARHPPCRKSARRPACSQKHLRSCTSFWAFYLKRRFLVVFGCFTDQVLDIHLFRPPFARNIGAFIIQPGGGSLQS